MRLNKEYIMVLILFALVGCRNTKSENNVAVQTKEDIDSLCLRIEYKDSDSIFNKLLADSVISEQEAYLIKEYICPTCSNNYGTYKMTYREAINISHFLEKRIDSLKMYNKSISFPFQLGKSLTVPQIIAFGKRKDVRMKPQTRDVYMPDPTAAGNRKKFVYAEHLPNHLENLEKNYKYNKKAFYYYTKDSSFVFKYLNFISFDFSKNGLDYDTHVKSYGNRVMEWSITCNQNLRGLYIEKYGDPLFTNTDTTFLCWDFKNIRIEISTQNSQWLSKQTVLFRSKEVYREQLTHSKLVEEREKIQQLQADEKAKVKAYRDSIKLVERQFLDL